MHLSHTHINALIEERYRKRGEAYFHEGMVELVYVTETRAKAKCAGTRMYTTSLELKNGKLTGECTCPAFEDFGPCKHMAAVAYATMLKTYEPSEDYEERKEECEEIEARLKKYSKSALIGMIMQAVQEDPELLWQFGLR